MCNIRILLLFLSAFLLIIYISLGLELDIMPYNYILLLVLNLYMVFSSRYNPSMFIISFIILFCNYSLVYGMYINMTDDMFISVLSNKAHLISLNLLIMMNALLFLFFRWTPTFINKISSNSIYFRSGPASKMVFYGLFAFLFLIFFIGYTAPEVEGTRGETSPLYEYSAILFIILFHYFGNNILYRRCGLFLVTLFCLQSFLYGGRIEGIQFALCAYLMLYSHKMSMPKLFLILFGAFFLMTLIGSVRGAILSGNYDLYSIGEWTIEHGFASDTVIYAYYASESYVYAMDRIPTEILYQSFANFVKSIFIGGNIDLTIQELSKNYTMNLGGCLLPFPFYIYLGKFGVLLITLLMVLYFSVICKIRKESSGYLKCLAVWIVCTTFRWYLYYSLVLLRGVMFLTFAYFLISYANRVFCKWSSSSKWIVQSYC